MFRRTISNLRLRRADQDETSYLHEDFQPHTPASKVNLQTRFVNGNLQSDNQYVNWRPPRRFRNGEQIYENHNEVEDALDEDQMDEAPPPLPPRNHGPVTPSHFHHTSIHLSTHTGNVEEENVQPVPQDCTLSYQPIEQPSQPSVQRRILDYQPSKPSGHSRSYSALQRLSVKPFGNVNKHVFNKSFSGQENIYCNADDTSPGDIRNSGGGMGALWDNIQDSVMDSKPIGSKLFKFSGRKFTQVAQGCKTAISNISQKFKTSTQRRYRLDNSSPKRTSYSTPPRGSIRRTPGKMYTPFNVATPPTAPPRNFDVKRLQPKTPRSFSYDNGALRRTPRGGVSSPQSVHDRLGPRVRGREGEPSPPPPYHHNTSLFSTMHTSHMSRAPSCDMNYTMAADHSSLLPGSDHSDSNFRRHLVEFNQVTRNVSTKLNRGNRFRSSMR